MQIKIETYELGILESYQVETGQLKQPDSKGHVILIPGFGSGWTGMIHMGVAFHQQGWNVIMVSLPGYGNSADPPRRYDFVRDGSRVLAYLLKKLNLPEKPVVIGHSLAAKLVLQMTNENPSLIKKVIALNPAGLSEQSWWRTLFAFIVSGLDHALRQMIWGEKLSLETPKEKSPFARGRIRQRLKESWAASKRPLKFLASPSPHPCPNSWGKIVFVFSSGDPVYRWKSRYNNLLKLGAKYIKISGPHNTTVYRASYVVKHIEENI